MAHVKRLVVMAVFVMFAAACGDTTTETSDAANGEQEWRSPLAEYMGVDLGFDFGDEAEMEARQLEVNEKVAACMAAEGFEWKPDPEEMMMAGPPVDDEGLEWGSDEWTAKYGFGVSTMAFPQETVGPDLIGSPDSFMDFEGEEYVDPNAEYLEALSEAEREEYFATLHGDDQGPDIDFEAMTEEEIDAALEEYYSDYVPTGCMNEAQEEVMGFGGRDYFMEFQDELEKLYEQIEDDPRIASFEQEISTCVSEKGLSYTDMQTMYEDLDERMRPLYDEAFNQQPTDMPSEEEMASMSEREMQELFAPKLSDESKATLGEIQADELALAAAVQECGGNDADRAAVYQEVTIEYEERFIEENRAALDAYLAEQESENEDE